MDELKGFIKTLPEYEEFMDDGNRKNLEKVAEFLLDEGLEMYEIKYVISTIYNASASEHGG